jgi:hypothetical protein
MFMVVVFILGLLFDVHCLTFFSLIWLCICLRVGIVWLWWSLLVLWHTYAHKHESGCSTTNV